MLIYGFFFLYFSLYFKDMVPVVPDIYYSLLLRTSIPSSTIFLLQPWVVLYISSVNGLGVQMT